MTVLEQILGLNDNEDFFVDYSIERINPGDKEHIVTKILKLTPGSTSKVKTYVDGLYKTVIISGKRRASSIKVEEEEAKVIENFQKDINNAFVNKLSKIFNLLDTDVTSFLSNQYW